MNIVRRFTIAMIAVLPLSFTSFAVKAGDIVETAASAEQFSTLVAAVKAAGSRP